MDVHICGEEICPGIEIHQEIAGTGAEEGCGRMSGGRADRAPAMR
jgi:hypothetical protein